MRLNKLARITILNFSLANVASTIFPGKTTCVLITAICMYSLFLIYFNNFAYFRSINFKEKKSVFLFFILGIFIFIHSLFVGSNYDDFNYLFIVFAPSLLLPLIIILAANLNLLFFIIKNLFIYAIPLSFVLYFKDINFNSMYDFTGFISFIYLLILFIPFVKYSLKFFIIYISILSLFYNLDDRTNVIMILSCGFGVILYYFVKTLKRNSIFISFFIYQRIILLSTPLILLILGMTGIFNIFSSSDDGKIRSNNKISTNDSRSFLYYDALTDLYTKNKLIYGISATGRYKTQLMHTAEYEGYKNGRLSSEVGILEYLLRGGLIYCGAFFILIYTSTKTALYHSNNDFSKLIGFYICIYWIILILISIIITNAFALSIPQICARKIFHFIAGNISIIIIIFIKIIIMIIVIKSINVCSYY
jgi:hypothetical protein